MSLTTRPCCARGARARKPAGQAEGLRVVRWTGSAVGEVAHGCCRSGASEVPVFIPTGEGVHLLLPLAARVGVALFDDSSPAEQLKDRRDPRLRWELT